MTLQNVEFCDHGASFTDLGNIACIANSQFTADRYRGAFGVEPRVIHPIIDRKKYETHTTRENVTFINPNLLKGLDVALAVARRCPGIPFSFVQSWPLGMFEHRALMDQLAELPNVNLLPAVRDMRQIYGKCRILIAPSRWEEAYGRVVTEAQYSGIPVVASNRGGLPEAVGSGGLLVDPDGPISHWVSAVNRLWYDDACYSMLSAAAYSHSQRPSLNQTRQLDMWEDTLFQVIEQHRRHSVSPAFVAHPLAQRSFSASHQDWHFLNALRLQPQASMKCVLETKASAIPKFVMQAIPLLPSDSPNPKTGISGKVTHDHPSAGIDTSQPSP
jgi:hypothetical protein